MSRGAKMARLLGHEDEAREWERQAERERAIILDRGYSAKHGYFTQALDGRYLDAANLLLPTIGVIDARDMVYFASVIGFFLFANVVFVDLKKAG